MVRTNVRVSAVILKEDEILLIHRFKNGEEYWVFPGGGVEDTETAQEGIVREVKEETNLDVLKCDFAFMSFNESSKKEEPFYFCEVSGGTPEIVGEEKDKNSSENSYQLEWVELNTLSDISLVPMAGKKKVLELHKPN